MSTDSMDPRSSATEQPIADGAAAPTETESRAEEPRPWHTAEDGAAWRVRYRGRDGIRAGAAPHTIKQSVLVDLDDAQIAWLERRAAKSGLTLAGCVKQLIEIARSASEPPERSVPNPAIPP